MKEIREFIKKLQGKKLNELLIVITLVAIVFIFISDYAFNGGKSSNKTDNTNNVQTADASSDGTSVSSKDEDYQYEKELEDKLTDILESMDKVGKVKVMIHLGAGEEKVPVYNSNDSTSVTEEKDNNGGDRKINQSNSGNTVVMKNDNGNSEPFVTQTKKPIITGVIVIAEGADVEVTKLIITKTVTDLFSIGANKVNVYPMKK